MTASGFIGAWMVALVLTPTTADDSAGSGQKVTVEGQAVLLTDVLKAAGVQVDTGPVERQVAIRDADGAIHPLLLDDASRALFQDERLRDRPIRVEATRRAGLPYLQVLVFQVREGDGYRTPEYWCEVCSISWRFDADPCPCCQGPMILRMKPDRR